MNAGKYQDKYRIASARLAGWDYGSNAAYFITICTHNRVPAFGQVIAGEVKRTRLGQAASDCWLAIPAHFPFVVLDEFVVMPNHVHGIVVIDKPSPYANARGEHGVNRDVNRAVNRAVETQNFASLHPGHDDHPGHNNHPDHDGHPGHHHQRRSVNQFGPQSQNLASIVRGVKIGVTKFARQHQIPFAWQARYHDIIRNAADYERIREYIMDNPQKWEADRFYRH